jgi:hypothetical protein
MNGHSFLFPPTRLPTDRLIASSTSTSTLIRRPLIGVWTSFAPSPIDIQRSPLVGDAREIIGCRSTMIAHKTDLEFRECQSDRDGSTTLNNGQAQTCRGAHPC